MIHSKKLKPKKFKAPSQNVCFNIHFIPICIVNSDIYSYRYIRQKALKKKAVKFYFYRYTPLN